MKHLQLFETWTYDKLVSRYTDEDDELKDIFKKYIAYKTNRNVTSVYKIYYDKGELWVSYYLLDDNDREMTTEFWFDNPDEFDDFAKDPDVYLAQKKYNI